MFTKTFVASGSSRVWKSSIGFHPENSAKWSRLLRNGSGLLAYRSFSAVNSQGTAAQQSVKASVSSRSWTDSLFGFTKPKLAILREAADANPSDPIAQQKLLEVLLVARPDEVISRYESGSFTMNEACKELYLNAAYQLKMLGKINVSTPDAANVVVKQNPPPPVQVMMVQSRQEHYWSMLRFGLGLTVPVGLFAMLYYSIMDEKKDQEEAPISRAHTLSPRVSTRFEDVKGVDEAKEELQEVVQYLKNPEKFTSLGAKLPKGVLLVGEPGTGKTLLARAVAGEADVPFLYVSGSAFDEMFVGVGPRRVRDLFEEARRLSPCIIFIDELDAVGLARKYNISGSHAKESTLNQLLCEMDGFQPTSGIMVLAATNLPETLDTALTRPGRFDKQVVVPTPDIAGRRQILDLYLKKTKVAPDVCAETIARGTTGFSGAELSNLINLAAIKAASSGALHVDMKTIEDARDDIIMGGKKRGVVQTEQDKRVTAYHEGGHALVALYSSGAHPIHKATIIQRGNALGTTSFLPERDEVSVSKKQMYSRLRVAMGGRAAEEVVFGGDEITTGASSDFNSATNLARAMVQRLGFSERVGQVFHDGKHKVSEKELELIDSEVKGLLQSSYDEAKKILKEHRRELDLLAENLLKHETLSADEILQVISGKKLEKAVASSSPDRTGSSIPLTVKGKTPIFASQSSSDL
eukprot:TRINITY_DN5710_c0_g1_i2.p1 TRINITY_DN5710_c0_g1~~TRINITY_DN5710_c0_g1_i2.p1  ORF type:complete len:695 (-),score=203.30 TRINITY_DN5710_c0_g1_i2:60-2144(-)